MSPQSDPEPQVMHYAGPPLRDTRPMSRLGQVARVAGVAAITGHVATPLAAALDLVESGRMSGLRPYWAVFACGLAGVAMGVASFLHRRDRRGSYFGAIAGLVCAGLALFAVLHGGQRLQMYQRLGSSTGLTVLHAAALDYQRGHGVLPPDLPTLAARSGYPGVGRHRHRLGGPARPYDFVYLPPAPGSPPATTIMACDLGDNQEKGRRFVLYADGRVVGPLSPAACAAEFARPENAAFAAALRAAEGP